MLCVFSGFINNLNRMETYGVFKMGGKEIYLPLQFVLRGPIIIALQNSDVVPAAGREGIDKIMGAAKVNGARQNVDRDFLLIFISGDYFSCPISGMVVANNQLKSEIGLLF